MQRLLQQTASLYLRMNSREDPECSLGSLNGWSSTTPPQRSLPPRTTPPPTRQQILPNPSTSAYIGSCLWGIQKCTMSVCGSQDVPYYNEDWVTFQLPQVNNPITCRKFSSHGAQRLPSWWSYSKLIGPHINGAICLRVDSKFCIHHGVLKIVCVGAVSRWWLPTSSGSSWCIWRTWMVASRPGRYVSPYKFITPVMTAG
jgi:hypothetical protein